MPKNKGKGGKKFRRGKHDNESKRPLLLKNDDEPQCYGYVSKILGGGRFTVDCYEKNDSEFIKKERNCSVRGSMRKRVWVKLGDVVLVSLRTFQDSKADIMYRYEEYEVPDLIKLEHIPNISDLGSTDDVEFDFNDISSQEDESDNDSS